MDKLVSSCKRKDVRIPFKSDVQFSVDQFNWHLDKAHDISKSGIFIETGKMFKVGSKVYLSFDLITDFQVKNIKAMGKVVRLVDAEEKAGGREGSGIGIKFSLLPSEEFMIHSFIGDIVRHLAPGSSSSLHQPAKPICVEAEISSVFLLKWWFMEVVSKTSTLKGLLVELVFIMVIFAIVFYSFFI